MIVDSRSRIRFKNRELVLQQLFNAEVTSRVEIARALQLNKSTVSSIYNELDQEGFIEEAGRGDSTSSGGRKPDLVKLNKRYGYVASFEIGTAHLRMMFNYLNGEIISYEQVEQEESDLLSIMKVIKERLRKMTDFDNTQEGLLAIGFAIHGVVNDGKINDSPFIETDGLDLQKYFEENFGVPVILENEANLAAVFERDFGQEDEDKDIVTISIHRGIGAGVIANGRLYRGYRGMAGEIGRNLIADTEGKLVKVENLCSEESLLALARQKTGTKYKRATFAQAYREGVPEIESIVDESMDQLSKVAYNAANNYGPQTLYFSSPLFDELPELYQQVRDWLVKRGLKINIKMIAGSEMSSLLGAGSLAIRTALGLQKYRLVMQWPKKVTNVD